jgi:hypothetical protein
MSDPNDPDQTANGAHGSNDESNTTDPCDPAQWPREIGGVRGPEPTRYGDWERNGRCSDF